MQNNNNSDNKYFQFLSAEVHSTINMKLSNVTRYMLKIIPIVELRTRIHQAKTKPNQTTATTDHNGTGGTQDGLNLYSLHPKM